MRWGQTLLAAALLTVMCGCRDRVLDMNAPVIALFTDFGTVDPYVAQMKGAILQAHPGTRLVDLTHEVPSFDVAYAAWLLEKSVRYLPEDAVVVAVVDPGVGGRRLPVALRTRSGRTYIGPDNGIFSWVVRQEKLAEAREITNEAMMRPAPRSATFHGRDIFGPVAARLAAGDAFDRVGPVLKKLLVLPVPLAAAVGDRVTGQVMHIDRFGNILTNITRQELSAIEGNALIKVTLGARVLSLPLVPHYEAAPERRPFALLNSDGELEIALKEGSAAAALKAERGQRVILQR